MDTESAVKASLPLKSEFKNFQACLTSISSGKEIELDRVAAFADKCKQCYPVIQALKDSGEHADVVGELETSIDGITTFLKNEKWEEGVDAQSVLQSLFEDGCGLSIKLEPTVIDSMKKVIAEGAKWQSHDFTSHVACVARLQSVFPNAAV